jgi:cobalamin biosynthesis protein CobC
MVSDKSMDEAFFPEWSISLQAEHGGDLSAVRLAYPQAREPWLDLSTGINPYSYPFGELPPDCLTKLPCPTDLRLLEEAAARAYGIPPHAKIVAAPGSQAIIDWLPHLIPARRVGILGFTYCEFARSWGPSGAKVMVATELAALQHQDVAIVVNPNNPDGRLVAKQDLHALAAALVGHGGLLIVDEAFVDFVPGTSIVPEMPASGIMVLRSFGKTYGLPGLRLGFAIAPAEIAARLRTAFGPWPVSGAAIVIGTRAFIDPEWLAITRERLKVDAAAVDKILAAAGFAFLGGTPLFRLVQHREALRLYEGLAQAGILARRFVDRPDWLRFGIVSLPAGRMRLSAALGLELAPKV